MTGYSGSNESQGDYATAAYDAFTGKQLWVSRLGTHGGDIPYAIAVSPDGTRVFVTGVVADMQVATVAYRASTGVRLWRAFYSGPNHSYDKGSSLGVSPDGTRVFIIGTTYSFDTGPDYLTIAYSAATGKRLWLARYDGPNEYDDDEAFSLAVSPGGARVFVTGQSWRDASEYDYVTVAYGASSGRRLWARRYNGPGNLADTARSVRVSPNGSRVFVTGDSDGGGAGLDYATIAYTASTGSRLWVSRYNGTGNGHDGASSLRVSPKGGRIFVTGKSTGVGSGLDYATVAYASGTGAQLWASRYNGPANGEDFASSVGMSRYGTKVFVTGNSSEDYATIAYSASTGT